jgi:hypothetical protein
MGMCLGRLAVGRVAVALAGLGVTRLAGLARRHRGWRARSVVGQRGGPPASVRETSRGTSTACVPPWARTGSAVASAFTVGSTPGSSHAGALSAA